MVLRAQFELLLGLHTICIPYICISASDFKVETKESEKVITRRKQYFAMWWTSESCFFDTGSCVWIHTVTLKTITNTSSI